MRLVVGVSGGSGIPYALSVLRALHDLHVETHLVVSSGAKRVMSAMMKMDKLDIEGLKNA